MSEEENLRKAYFVLGLEPGSPLDTINRRYKRLIMVWHPDRFPTADGKKDAEEELKQINNAKDKLKAHFDAGHKPTGPCACKPTAHGSGGAGPSAARPGPGPGRRSKTTEETNREEAEAKQRSEERARKAAQEAAEKERQQREAGAAAASQQSVKDAVDQTKTLEDERLRWKIAIGMGAAWVLISLFGWLGMGIKDWWHDFSWKWERDHPSHSDSSSGGSNIGSGTDTSTSTQPYIPPYEQTPGGNQTTWQQQHDQDQQRRDEEAKKQKDQDIYFTKLEIDKYQKIIEHCNSELTGLEIKIADPSVSYFEKQKLIDMRNFRQQNLSEAQTNLQSSQDKLSKLQGDRVPLQTTPSIASPFNTDRPGIPLVPIPERKGFFSSTPSTYTSPFAPAQNPGTVPNDVTSKPMFDLSKQGGALNPNSVPDSSQSSLDYFSKLKTIPLTPSTPAPQTQTNTSTSLDGASMQSLLDSFKKRRVNRSLEDILKNTDTNTGTGTSP